MIITLDVLLVCCICCFMLGIATHYLADYLHQRKVWRKSKKKDKNDFRLPSRKQQDFDIIDDE
jgi:hypothetical protein